MILILFSLPSSFDTRRTQQHQKQRQQKRKRDIDQPAIISEFNDINSREIQILFRKGGTRK